MGSLLRLIVVVLLLTIIIRLSKKLYENIRNAQSKEGPMEKEVKKDIIGSGSLILASSVGLAYFLNPDKFKKKISNARDAIKKAVGA